MEPLSTKGVEIVSLMRSWHFKLYKRAQKGSDGIYFFLVTKEYLKDDFNLYQRNVNLPMEIAFKTYSANKTAFRIARRTSTIAWMCRIWKGLQRKEQLDSKWSLVVSWIGNRKTECPIRIAMLGYREVSRVGESWMNFYLSYFLHACKVKNCARVKPEDCEGVIVWERIWKVKVITRF